MVNVNRLRTELGLSADAPSDIRLENEYRNTEQLIENYTSAYGQVMLDQVLRNQLLILRLLTSIKPERVI